MRTKELADMAKLTLKVTQKTNEEISLEMEKQMEEVVVINL